MAKTAYLIGVFVFVFIFVTIGHFPLRLAISVAGPRVSAAFSARKVTGTVWAGRAQEASFNGLFLGDVQLRNSLLKLLSSSPSMQLSWQGPRSDGTALLSVGSDTVSLSRIESRIAISSGTIQGTVQLSNGIIIQSKQRCDDASGDVTLSSGAGQVPNTGRLLCDEGTLAMSLELGGVTRAIPLVGAL